MHNNSNSKRSYKIRFLWFWLAILTVLGACGSDDDSPQSPPVVESPVPPIEDTTPEQFGFAAIFAAPSEIAESETVTILGIDTAAAITITGGEYSIDGGPYTAAAGTISNSQTLSVRLTAPDEAGAVLEALLTVGGVSASFRVTNSIPLAGSPIATNQTKFLGGVCCGRQAPDFTKYWNQVTPENAGKWGSVEGTRDVYNWTALDDVYAMAEANGYVSKMHVLVWGNQQPRWIRDLPVEEQLEEIREWFSLVSERYPEFDYVEVVNEFDNDPPDSANDGPGYIDALRLADAATTTELIEQFVANGEDAASAAEHAAEFDWIINSFQMARDLFPASTKLMINEYNVVNSDSRTTKMMEIVELLKARNLIDAVGFQGHAFSTTGSNQAMLDNIDRLATLDLDLFVTELDIDGPTDLVQLLDYQRLFPMFWEHEAIKGITVWGYLPGHWREAQGAHLASEAGVEKPALVWLRAYVYGQSPLINDPGNVGKGEELAEDTPVDTVLTTLSATAFNGEAASGVEWSILGGNGSESYAIDSATGAVSVQGALIPGENQVYVQAKSGTYTSLVLPLAFLVPGEVEVDAPAPFAYDFVNGLSGWRVDFGSSEFFSVAHNAVAEAAEVTPDWNEESQYLIVFVPDAPLNFTGARLEYTVTVTQAQANAGLMVTGVVQTGQPEGWTQIRGASEVLVEGENTFIFSPVDNADNNLQVIERVAIEFSGLQNSGNTDTILINNIDVSFEP